MVLTNACFIDGCECVFVVLYVGEMNVCALTSVAPIVQMNDNNIAVFCVFK